MLHLKELIPQGLKAYIRLIQAKLRHPGCFIASPAIGKGVSLGHKCSIATGAELSGTATLGDYSYVNSGAVIASGRIGHFCSIGPYAMVGMPVHPTSFRSTSPRLYGSANIFGTPSSWNDFPKPPTIGSDVWIGAFAFVKQGVHIGHGAVIGAGAVVTRDVMPYAIVAGVPAKLVRYRFDPDTVEKLLRSRWWEKSISELASMADSFQMPEPEFIREEVCSR